MTTKHGQHQWGSVKLVLSCISDTLHFPTLAAFAYLIITYWSSSREGLSSKLQCQTFRIKGIVLDCDVITEQQTKKYPSISQSAVQPQTCVQRVKDPLCAKNL